MPGPSKDGRPSSSPIGSGPILDAMRKLDPDRPNGPMQQPSLVRQLYALALLNREDAMRRLSGRVPADLQLSHQPPSLLALAQPPAHSASPAFRPRQFLAPAPTPKRKPKPAATSRPFGALSMSEQCGGTETAASKLAAAREPSLATTAMGAPAKPRFDSWRPPMTAPGVGGGVYGLDSSMPASYAYASQSMQLSGERSQSAAAYVGGGRRPMGGGGGGGGLAVGSLTPLRVTDLEQSFPTRVSNYRDTRDPAVREQLLREHHAKAGTPLGSKDNKLSVRLLLEPAGGADDPAGARLNAAARSTATRPKSRGGGGTAPRGSNAAYVPDPRLEVRDPWKASEEELGAIRAKEQHDDEMSAIRMAAAVGAGSGVLPGFGK